MLQRPDRLRRMRDFALLSQRGRVVFGPNATLRFRVSGSATRVGFVASTKIFKTAISRNRVKRRLREALRALQAVWPKGMDMLFIARPETLVVPYDQLIASIKRTLEKIPDALKEPPKPRKNIKARKKTSVVFKHESSA